MNQLRDHYQRQDTEELLELCKKDLTDEARVELNKVLGERGVPPVQVAAAIRTKMVERQADEARVLKALGQPSARLAAFLIDALGSSVLLLLLFYPLASRSNDLHQLAVVATWWPYMLFRDAPTGRSFGKRLLGLRVVGVETGAKCTWGQSFWRNLTHFFFVVDAVFMLGKRRMRLGDMIARTVVVRSTLPAEA